MASLVLDASVAVGWILQEEATAIRAEAVIRRVVQEGATAPGLWPFEVANALLISARRGRIALENAEAALVPGMLPARSRSTRRLAQRVGPGVSAW